jgi:hypothetical protein
VPRIISVWQSGLVVLLVSVTCIILVCGMACIWIPKPNSWTYSFVEVWAQSESSHTLGFSLKCLHYKPGFKPLLLKERGGGRSRSDCEWQGGKLLRLLSHLRPRNWPLASQIKLCWVIFSYTAGSAAMIGLSMEQKCGLPVDFRQEILLSYILRLIFFWSKICILYKCIKT